MGTIRLACLFCDCDEHDGVDDIPADWQDVDEIQSYEDAMSETKTDGSDSSVWWTHIGVCPECETQQCRLYEGAQQQES